MLNVPGLNFRNTFSLPGDVSSADVLAGLQNTFGAQNYNDQSVSRYTYYSGISYPLAGTNKLAFFTSNQSQVGQFITNITTPNNLGDYSMLISAISFDVALYLPTVANNPPWSYLLDADCPYPDIVHGFTQGGYAEFVVNNTTWYECPRPFEYSPACIGKNRMQTSMSAGNLSQAGMTPFAVTGASTSLCYADVERRSFRRQYLTNKIFLAPQTTFSLTINYDFGAIPVIGTSMITNAATPPTAGAIVCFARFDGLRYSPVS